MHASPCLAQSARRTATTYWDEAATPYRKMVQILSIQLQIKQGERAGLRLNNADEVCGVHPDSAAHQARLVMGDVVIAMDGRDCGNGVTALQLWSEGKERETRIFTIRRRCPTAALPGNFPQSHRLYWLFVKYVCSYQPSSDVITGRRSGRRQ